MKNTAIGIAVIAALIGTPALAADMAVKAPPSAPDSTFSWTGWYIGGDIGGAWTSNTGTWNPLPSPAFFGVFGTSGGDGGSAFIGGFHAGYNYQFAPMWIAGVEGDWSWTKASGSYSQPWRLFPTGTSFPSSTTMSSTLDWVSSLRGRFGYLATPALMVYATGGVAWARYDYMANANDIATRGPAAYVATTAVSSTQRGYVLGGGLEWAMTKNWFVRAEYLYYRFGNAPNVLVQFANPLTDPSGFVWSATHLSVARAGLSFRF